jgi:hypothetical protein
LTAQHLEEVIITLSLTQICSSWHLVLENMSVFLAHSLKSWTQLFLYDHTDKQANIVCLVLWRQQVTKLLSACSIALIFSLEFCACWCVHATSSDDVHIHWSLTLTFPPNVHDAGEKLTVWSSEEVFVTTLIIFFF